MKDIKFKILNNCFIIIYKIDNNLLLFINDYKLELIKNLTKINYKDPLFILDLNEQELKIFCTKIIKKIIGCD